MTKSREMTETLANGYSSESTQRGLFYEYQHDRLKMFFMISCFCTLDESNISIRSVVYLLMLWQMRGMIFARDERLSQLGSESCERATT